MSIMRYVLTNENKNIHKNSKPKISHKKILIIMKKLMKIHYGSICGRLYFLKDTKLKIFLFLYPNNIIVLCLLIQIIFNRQLNCFQWSK